MAATEQTIEQVNALGNSEYKYGFNSIAEAVGSRNPLPKETPAKLKLVQSA